jgi:hypothetical protein
MKMVASLAGIVLLVLLFSHDSSVGASPAISATTAPVGVEIRGTRHIFRLPEAPAALPSAPGREAVMLACGVCHTPNYITLQPPFAREIWIAEVTKMRKTYMAPIPDDKVDEIVNYLVAVRGK